jgi:hypothetical protein
MNSQANDPTPGELDGREQYANIAGAETSQIVLHHTNPATPKLFCINYFR